MSTQATGYVAFDLGAESGRSMLGILRRAPGQSGLRLALEETHRFANSPQLLPSGLHWNLLDLWANLIQGLRLSGQAAGRRRVPLVSLGVDTWGVDMALVGRSGQLLGLPFAYRDQRHAPAMKRTLRRWGQARIYNATGIQFLPFNTLFQLVAAQGQEPAMLEQARRMVNMPDLLHYFFSGKLVNEATIASTTQMVDPRTGKWAVGLLKRMGLPTHMLGKIVPAGTRIGRLRTEVMKEAQVPSLQVIVPGSHDTASAIAAVPVDQSSGKTWAYLSSGTWSLIGAELDQPIITDAARRAGFTNERGVEGKIRFLKNIAGLWLVQECRRDFARRGREMDYVQLTRLASQAPPFRTLLNPNHAPFASPGDMPAKIAAYARQTRQPVPRHPGEYVRCCLESLALEYRRTLRSLQDLLGLPVQVLHIVGGGGRNELLNQFTADALNLPVVVGPYEATAIGNALTQALGYRQVRNLRHLRAVVRASFPVTMAKPRHPETFDKHWPRYLALVD